MKANNLVRFDRKIVNELLEEEYLDWEEWNGIVLKVYYDEEYCDVMWSDSVIRQEFVEYLEII